MKKFPEIPQGLIDRLVQTFPDQCPRSDPGAFGLGKLVGAQEVIDLLKMQYQKQQEARHVHA